MWTAAMLLGACVPGDDARTHTARPSNDDSAPDSVPDSVPDSASDPGRCPNEMALVSAGAITAGTVTFCIDRWEAHILDWSPYDVPDGTPTATAGVAASVEGEVPQGYISGATAANVCANAGKRLCTGEEWLTACSGQSDGDGRTYPYGDAYDSGACNDTYEGSGSYGHPVCDYFDDCSNVWDAEHMNDTCVNQQPGTVAAAGANPDCVTPEAVYDLHGNLHEWIDTPSGTFKGGFYADGSINGPGCSYATTAHEFSYHDYSTGFRCCKLPE